MTPEDQAFFAGTGDDGKGTGRRKKRRAQITSSTRPKPFAAWANGTIFKTYYMGLMKKAVRPEDSKRLKDEEESCEQRACVRWFNAAYSEYAGCLQASLGDLLMSTGVRQSAIARGYVPGTSDFFLAVAKHTYFGFYCELKRDGGGVTSDEQKEFLALMATRGYFTCVAHGLREFHQHVEWYMACRDTRPLVYEGET